MIDQIDVEPQISTPAYSGMQKKGPEALLMVSMKGILSGDKRCVQDLKKLSGNGVKIIGCTFSPLDLANPEEAQYVVDLCNESGISEIFYDVPVNSASSSSLNVSHATVGENGLQVEKNEIKKTCPLSDKLSILGHVQSEYTLGRAECFIFDGDMMTNHAAKIEGYRTVKNAEELKQVRGRVVELNLTSN